MNKREDLLISIFDTIKDYRQGEIEPITPETVDRWISQFRKENQNSLLYELNHVLSCSYISKTIAEAFLSKVLFSRKLAGNNPSDYWRNVNFLNIQAHGHSQSDLISDFSNVLQMEYGFDISQCGSAGGDFIYLDDAIFSGNRVSTDLEKWIENDAPENAHVNVIVYALYTGGEWHTMNRINSAIEKSGKDVSVKYWRANTIENRKRYCSKSEVLWPKILPADARIIEYQSDRPIVTREYENFTPNLFSSEQSRELLEQEFLLSGLDILSSCTSHSGLNKPLGFGYYGLGFGSMIVTYRNCPNNCPLAFWWGMQDGFSGRHLSWYPLFPRKTYE